MVHTQCGKKQGFSHLICVLWTPWAFIKGIEKYKSALNNQFAENQMQH